MKKLQIFENWFSNLFPDYILSNQIVATFVKIFGENLVSKYKRILKETNYDV